jgi:hypothetical protein
MKKYIKHLLLLTDDDIQKIININLRSIKRAQ